MADEVAQLKETVAALQKQVTQISGTGSTHEDSGIKVAMVLITRT